MGQGASRSLGKNILAPVRQTFEQLIEDGVVTANPAARIGKYLKDKRGARATIEFLTPDEERVLLEAARVHFPRYYCVFLCALRTGLRIGELFGLQWGDLDIKGRFIEARRQVRDGKVIPTLKNRRIRRVDMSDQLAEALMGLLVERKRETLQKGWGRVPEWVFCNEEGRPLWKSTFERRVFHRLLQTAGLRRRRFHALRHTFASRLLQNRESPAYVKEQMGHSSIQVTVDIYGHLMPGANRARSGGGNGLVTATGRNPRATRETKGVTGVPVTPSFNWSGREDLNLRPHDPQSCALPGCATPRPSLALSQTRREGSRREQLSKGFQPLPHATKRGGRIRLPNAEVELLMLAPGFGLQPFLRAFEGESLVVEERLDPEDQVEIAPPIEPLARRVLLRTQQLEL